MKLILWQILIVSFLSISIEAQDLVNGNFDLGPSTGWIKKSVGNYGLIATADFFNSTEITPEVFPRSGQYMARIGGFAYEVNSISQVVTLPNTTPIHLGMYYQDRAANTSECSGLWVGAEIKMIVADQTLLNEYLCQYNTVNNWTYVYFDLSAAAGKTVTIEIKAEAANSVWSFLYLDDISLTSDVSVPGEIGSAKFQLNQNYPNPFNSTTLISYSLSEESFVKLKIYDVLGQKISDLVNDLQSPGNHQINFSGNNLSPGAYYYSIEASNNKGEVLYKDARELMITK
jgi:hypothetical protein